MASDGPESAALISFRSAGRMLRPVHRHLIVCTVLSALAAAGGLAPFVAVAEIARTSTAETGSAAAIWTWVAVGAVGALVKQVCEGLSFHVGHLADARMQLVLRERIVSRLARVPMGWFSRSGSPRVNKAMTKDLDDMHNLFAHSLGELVGSVTAIAVVLGYLVTVDVPMALVTIAVPVAVLIGYQVSMRSMPVHLARLIEVEQRLAAAVVDHVDGIAVAKTFGAGQWSLRRCADVLAEYRAAFARWVREIRTRLAVGQVLSSELTVVALVLGVGVTSVGAGALAAPDLVPFLVLGIGLPATASVLINGVIGLRTARTAGGELERLLATPALPVAASPRIPAGHRIEFDDVRFFYDGHGDAVAGVSAVCEPGTVTALVGPSGAGKTTLAALLARHHDVSGGAIRIGGVDVRDIAPDRLLASMALVFQDVVLLRETVRDNIRIGRPDATDDDVRRAAKAAHVHDVIESLPRGYDTELGADGGGLSGGQQQRLTIARAILSGAPIVVLDEATAALDPDSESAVQDAMAELISGRTVLVIAHRLHTVRDADQVLVLDHGRVAERGTHDDLLTRGGRYARMWASQRQEALR